MYQMNILLLMHFKKYFCARTILFPIALLSIQRFRSPMRYHDSFETKEKNCTTGEKE